MISGRETGLGIGKRPVWGRLAGSATARRSRLGGQPVAERFRFPRAVVVVPGLPLEAATGTTGFAARLTPVEPAVNGGMVPGTFPVHRGAVISLSWTR